MGIGGLDNYEDSEDSEDYYGVGIGGIVGIGVSFGWFLQKSDSTNRANRRKIIS